MGKYNALMQLLALPGIGPWTVAYWRLRCGLDTDAFPASDLVLQKALGGGANEDEQDSLVASSLMAGIKSLLGVKPQQDYKDKVAEVPLD